jgi:plasmid stabilization system protein ParE
MSARHFFVPEARQDLADAYAWYEAQRPGLGDEFLSRVDECVRALCHMPEMHEVIYKNYRRAMVYRFPYSVFYEISGNDAIIYCVFHNARDPRKWRQRLP